MPWSVKCWHAVVCVTRWHAVVEGRCSMRWRARPRHAVVRFQLSSARSSARARCGLPANCQKGARAQLGAGARAGLARGPRTCLGDSRTRTTPLGLGAGARAGPRDTCSLSSQRNSRAQLAAQLENAQLAGRWARLQGVHAPSTALPLRFHAPCTRLARACHVHAQGRKDVGRQDVRAHNPCVSRQGRHVHVLEPVSCALSRTGGRQEAGRQDVDRREAGRRQEGGRT